MDSFVGLSDLAAVSFSGSKALFSSLERMTGAYVSLKQRMPSRLATPHKITMEMKTYLTPMLSVMKPPITGPLAPAVYD
jgi:hypothetical protein